MILEPLSNYREISSQIIRVKFFEQVLMFLEILIGCLIPENITAGLFKTITYFPSVVH